MEALSAFSLPPGFGFHPTDVELISHYLKRKILGQKIDFEVIPEVDIYKHEPWDLPARCNVPTRDNKWHFFNSRDKKYPNGSRSNRATKAGYWKSTGKDRNVKSHNRVIGTKKTLVFHEGRPPSGKRTEWIMHEYYINENECKSAPDMKDSYVLCRVTKRHGLALEDEDVSPQTDEIDYCVKHPKETAPLVALKETSTPSEEVEDFEKWVAELFDPDFPPISTLAEVKTETKEILDPRVLPEASEYPFLVPPVDDLYDIVQSDSQDFGSFGDFNIGSLDYLTETHEEVFFESGVTDQMASAYAAKPANDCLSNAEIQVRQRTAKPDTATTHRQRIRLQANKMETRNNGESLCRTVRIFNRGARLDPCNEKRVSTDTGTVTETRNSRQVSARPPTCSGGSSWLRGMTERLPNLLSWSSSASTNCCFLSACMVMGTGALISYFVLRDTPRFLGRFPAVDLQ
ncbi:NAC domain-containing protein 74-like [Iris pallida]|uniref:NAC domain-containing protein 74-like n=1 Tax=Iris pallida TaxID=29817 RepID=A0AAX6HWG1_IRIPA|nr:NAC domain-containing protein 74-like [Iris pallida]